MDLVDRSLAKGFVVKHNPQEAGSGTVISTSLSCTLQPDWVPSPDLPLGLPVPSDSIKDQIPGVDVQDLQIDKTFESEDTVIYSGWIGRVVDVSEEVTIRLSNWSVVVVEDDQELKEETPQSLKRRLSHLRYTECQSGEDHSSSYSCASPCYPGQMVMTKKGNLRRGRWIFGAYDPLVTPVGVVVNVRCIELQVDWQVSNFSKAKATPCPKPDIMVGAEVLENGDFKRYDRTRLPRFIQEGQELFNSHGECSAGLYVKFKDAAGAAVKYDGSYDSKGNQRGKFKRLPRAVTQGFDINVFQTRQTKSSVRVQWQDASVSEEVASSLVPYSNIDAYEVWPGEIVSLKESEESFKDDVFKGSTLARKIGVVQSTSAQQRIAIVRWFAVSEIRVYNDATLEKSILLPDSKLGQLTDHITKVSLYEIASYPALNRRRGDIVLLLPPFEPSNQIRNQWGVLPSEPHQPVVSEPFCSQDNSADQNLDPAGSFGEVVDVGLDGQLTVRLGALEEVRDVKCTVDRVVVVSSSDDDTTATDDSDEEDYKDTEDEDDISISSLEPEPASSTVEYEGGTRLDLDSDEEMWSADDETVPELRTDSVPSLQTDSVPPQMASEDSEGEDPLTEESDNTKRTNHPWKSTGPEISFSKHVSMPPQFSMLDDSPPPDHHFLSRARPALTRELLRSIAKEHLILRSSLPDGIFVRTWSSRLDLLRVLIIGPRGTPYELAPFLIDLHLHASFPALPPDTHFHSWTHGIGRVNPNLYEDGKICLSLLGTWPADKQKNEGWNGENSSILQIMVSLVGLVLVPEPFFNEAGFEALVGTEGVGRMSWLYSETAFTLSRGFLRTALEKNEGLGMGDLVQWLYLKRAGPELLGMVVEESKGLADQGREDGDGEQGKAEEGTATPRISEGALVLLRKTIAWLEEYWGKEREEEKLDAA